MMRDVAHQIRRPRYSGTGLLLVIGTLFPTIAHAGVGIWTSGGPYEPRRSVLALAIDPSTPATLYAGTYRAGVFKSTDSGGTWAAANTGLTIRDVYALAIDPATPTTLYAGGFRGVSKSTDSGDTWAAAGLASQIVNVLAIDPAIPSTLYAGTLGGVFKSTNSGGTWSAARLAGASVNALAINPANPATLYAGGQGGFGLPTGSGRGVFKSTNSGDTWTPAGLNDFFISALAIDPVTPTTLYAGRTGGVVGDKVFKSTDSGVTWVNAGLTNLDVSVLAIDPSNPSTLYAATGSEVFKSTDSGGTWAAVNVGLTNRGVRALAIDPLTTIALYAGTVDSGVFKSTNSGGNWVPANTGLTSLDVNALAISRSTPATLYAATSGGAYANEVFKSTDSGGTWIATGALLYDTAVLALATDPSTPATLYAGTIYGGVFKSTDSGVTWGAANAGMNGLTVRALVIDPSTPATLYAGADLGGVFKSIDSGGTWTAAKTGLTNLSVRALAVNPTTPATLYAGTGGGVFKSTDSGDTWAPANTGLSDLTVSALVVNPTMPATLYAGTNGGVFKSTDSGDSWASANTGLTNLSVRALAVNPTTPATLYAGTLGGGVFKSTDSGGTWAAYNTNLTKLNVNALALDPKGATTLYAGLSFGGVWQLTAPTGDATTAYLPSSARAPGAGGAFYTTDVTVANTGGSDTPLTLKFLGHDQDGTGGSEQTFALAAGKTVTYADVLGSVFGLSSGFGAIRITSPSASLNILGQTSTPGFGGTFGQSVPAAFPSDLITSSTPRSIVGVREDAAFRTNLILSNATSASLDVDVALFADTGANLGNKRYTLAPLGMTQVTRVVRDLGFPADVRGARVVLSTPTAGGSFAAYASAIDNATNDPRTLLPKKPIASPQSTNVWFLPSSARAPGAGGAFYTTDLTVSNTGGIDTTFTLKFLGHDQDGTGGSEQTFALAAGKTVTYADVLGSVFGLSSGFGAIRIVSASASLNILGQTSTPGFGGTFGQSVPASAPEDLIVSGLSRSLVAIREDAAFRTNLILCNTTPASLDVDGLLFAADGIMLAPTRYTLPPLGMMQVTRVVRDMGVSGDVNGARLVLWTPTPAGAFAAYASAIDNTTNDPRTLLPK